MAEITTALGLWTTLPSLLLLAGAYLCGSVPFGLILTKMAGLGDIRAIGSGNIGATNVLRTGNRKLALATLLLDGFKGVVPVIIAHYLIANSVVEASILPMVVLIAVIGHCFPLWLRFKGGKGVATALMTLIAAYWPAGVMACIVWFIVFKLSRYSSLSAICAMIAVPIAAQILYQHLLTSIILALVSLLVIARHHANIKRLLAGEESKSNVKKR